MKKDPWPVHLTLDQSPRLGGGPILVVSLSQLDTKKNPGNLPKRSTLFE